MDATTCQHCGAQLPKAPPPPLWELVFQPSGGFYMLLRNGHKAGACWPSDHHDGLFYAKYIETGASDYKTTEWQATPDMLLQWLTENAK